MSILSKPLAAGLLAVGLTSAATAAYAQLDVRSAREIAVTVCAACHRISAASAVPPVVDPPAPSFQAIADRPTTTRDSLRRFLAHTKWDQHNRSMTMPLMLLAPEEEVSLADYILGQRTTPSR